MDGEGVRNKVHGERRVAVSHDGRRLYAVGLEGLSRGASASFIHVEVVYLKHSYSVRLHSYQNDGSSLLVLVPVWQFVITIHRKGVKGEALLRATRINVLGLDPTQANQTFHSSRLYSYIYIYFYVYFYIN